VELQFARMKCAARHAGGRLLDGMLKMKATGATYDGRMPRAGGIEKGGPSPHE